MARFVVTIPLTLRWLPDARLTRLLQDRPTTLEVFPNTVRQVGALARTGVALWRERATKVAGAEGRPLTLGPPMVRLDRSAYALSIGLEPMVEESQGVSVSIGSEDPQAKVIESGGALIDLHEMLDYAPKARRSTHGHKYLRIPFRHATTAPGPGGQRFQAQSAKWGSNVLPAKVLAAMQSKRRYLVTGSYYERGPNVRRGMVLRHLYSRPGRLTSQELTALGFGPQTIEGRKLAGLMRVGRERHGGYVTIRTLSQAQPAGWRIDAYRAQHAAQATAQDLEKLAPTYFDAAIREDLTALLTAGGGGP